MGERIVRIVGGDPRWGVEKLLPVVVEDAITGAILMLAWVDPEALDATCKTGQAHFHSRSRDRLWRKGESSGNILEVLEIRVDCDGDALLYRVIPAGPACHTGTMSCFGDASGGLNLDWLARRIRERRGASPESSYTARLLQAGIPEIAKKLGEEAFELALAAAGGPDRTSGTDERVVEECADLLYHLSVLLEARGVSPWAVGEELRRRVGPPRNPRETEGMAARLVPVANPVAADSGPGESPEPSLERRRSGKSPGPGIRFVQTHLREFYADALTPVAALERISDLPAPRFLLESVVGGHQVGRYSFLGASPRVVYRLYEDRLERAGDEGSEILTDRPFERLRSELERHRSEEAEIPFLGGFVGSFGFDFVRVLERLPRRPPDPWNLPLAVVGRFDEVVVFDHARQRILLAANEIEGEVSSEEARAGLDRLEHRLRSGAAREVRLLRVPGAPVAVPVKPEFSADNFRRAVLRAQEEILAGEIFQVVLARRFTLLSRCSGLEIYRALRQVNPSPYMVLLDFPEVSLVGASPEALIQVLGRRVRTRPIAGTRARGADDARDRELELELKNDQKEQAEHVMLVDLGRNDLGRVAVPGSVRVARFAEVERYSHVMHLVSSVEAELAPEATALDALLAAFPAGTVSGAPKLRAIEILDSLEPEARGFYAGATGYLSYSGNLDTCITIRTLVVRGAGDAREVSVTAGAGIVADSRPDLEVRETENKAAGLLAAVALAESSKR